MAEIINFDTVAAFFKENQPYFQAQYYQHFYVIKVMEAIENQEVSVLDAFNVVSGVKKIIFLSTDKSGIYIYGDAIDDDAINSLYERATYKHYTNFHFAGSKPILDRLFDLKELPSSIDKSRIIYVANNILHLKRKHLGKAVNSIYADFETLTQMSYAYSIEEWGEREGRGIDYVQEMVAQCIEQQILIQYNVSSGIAAIAQVLNSENKMPIVGSLYTLPEKRGKGIATMLVHAITSKLLKSGFTTCGIISDATNPITNKMFSNIGFQAVSEHLSVICTDFGKRI
ncbi:GNAT family N-acetyltransferase [Mucilaginibacter panaciglaebae]|uniref:GCN5-related N-acetyltransferase Rv2170-like domain-containing protein n=1 Tax=Mucilaginibacter panaciglaebae TaxID=502331 RepID=A0ABP7W9V2_9SPHI